jgi:4-amino-4-deoxy-L-arabinose transferase-like glycosyltransferase
MAQADQDAAPTVTTIRPALLGLAALFALIILAQGISAPFQKDAEPQSAEWIQSIVRDGHWLIPTDAYGYFDRKPPLFYWLSATVTKLSGGTVDEVRARVVSLVAGTALAVCVLAWTAANLGALEGWLAFGLILGTYGFASRATEALTDMLLTLLLFAAYSLLRPLLDEPSRGSPRRTVLVGVILGLGVLTKGPVVLVLCALSALIYLLIVRRSPFPLLRERWIWQLLAISIIFGAVWYVPAMIAGKRGMLRIIVAENFGHFMPTKLGGTGESHRPFYFIAARLLGGAFPMTLLVPPAILAFATNELAPEKRHAVIYQASMPLAVLIFFSIASVKRDDYILPALPGIAILCASVFNLSELRGAAAKLRDILVATFVFCPVLAILFLAFFRNHAPSVELQSSDSAYYALFNSLSWAGAISDLLDVWLVAVSIESDRVRTCVRAHRASSLPHVDHDDAAPARRNAQCEELRAYHRRWGQGRSAMYPFRNQLRALLLLRHGGSRSQRSSMRKSCRRKNRLSARDAARIERHDARISRTSQARRAIESDRRRGTAGPI